MTLPASSLQRLQAFNYSNLNISSIFISDMDLFPGKTLVVQTTIQNAFFNTVSSATYIFLVPKIGSGKPYCGPCQLNDRTLCDNLNGICWISDSNYSISTPSFTTDCLTIMAPICFKIWIANGTTDSQCLDFVSYYNLTQMQIQPHVLNATYSIDGTIITVVFDSPIYRSNFIDCNSILTQETLQWLPSSKTGVWSAPNTLQINYNPSVGILGSLKFKNNVIYYDSPYSQIPLGPIIQPVLPSFL